MTTPSILSRAVPSQGDGQPPALRRTHRRYTAVLLAPGMLWMTLFLVLPILMMVYVSFWTQTTFTIEPTLTTQSWEAFFSTPTYLMSLWTTVKLWLRKSVV